METEIAGLTGPAALEGHIDLRADESAHAASRISTARRLRETRQRLGITGVALGAALGLGKDQISKIESGTRRLSVTELAKAAAFLGVSARYLLGEPDRPTMAVAARLAAGAGTESTHRSRQRARQLLEIDDLLTRVVGMPPARPSVAGASVLAEARGRFVALPRSLSARREQGRDLANLVRTGLNLGSDAIGDLAGVMERHLGVDVSLSPFGEETDGLCVHSGNNVLVLASSDFSAGHVRFTLAHELGHHLFDDPCELIEEDEHAMFSDTAVEQRANAFAGHLLMPKQGIDAVVTWLGERPRAVTARTVAALLVNFEVSLPALLNQLQQLKLMTSEQIKQLKRQYTAPSLLAAFPDVTAAALAVGDSRGVRRPPERLARYAAQAVSAQKLGVGVFAAVLEIEESEELWHQVVRGAEGAPPSIADDFEL